MSRSADTLRAIASRGAGLAFLVAPLLFAQTGSDGRRELEALRPTGPVTLTADRAEWVQGGEMQYAGHVSLQSDTLQLRGERMTVTQSADGQFVAHLEGTPSRLDHAGTPGAEGIAAQPVSAEAARMDYDSRAGIVQLSGNAKLQRGTDEVNGERIDYVIAERRIRAAGGESGQVRIVIQPPARTDARPSPSPARTPAP
ncbi:lipopolysaccharide transport periplasmic protein LptA [Fontimonas sp. SYSU GA230001]|uniref:lipopolysaccharide transport periplasmic protein LptA n=1 Tax=Fontimonas sp. SYSU GA230001 TaxID=3142450 RepID=UPI0032B62920